jgi:hypothetical protein
MPADPPPTPRFTAALEEELRERATRGRRLPSLRPLVAIAAVAVALAFVLLPGSDDGGEQASPPPPPPATVSRSDLLRGDLAHFRRLQRRFAAAGKRLIVRTRPVAPASRHVGLVLSMQLPDGYVPQRDDRVVLEELPGPVTVVVGVGDPDEKIEGLTICQTIPALNELMDGDDPDGSVRRMREAGFDVTVKTVPWDKPGDKDVIIGVYSAGGASTGVPPDTRKLTVEVGSPGGGHGDFGSC